MTPASSPESSAEDRNGCRESEAHHARTDQLPSGDRPCSPPTSSAMRSNQRRWLRVRGVQAAARAHVSVAERSPPPYSEPRPSEGDRRARPRPSCASEMHHRNDGERAADRAKRSKPRAMLLDFLRDDLGLTGAKRSCDSQVCGACTVLLDGSPVSSCCTLAYEASGRAGRDDRGSGGPNGLHPIQQAFIDGSAIQCGFCTPGLDPGDQGAAGREPDSDPRRDRAILWRESLPLHWLLEHPRRRRDAAGADR